VFGYIHPHFLLKKFITVNIYFISLVLDFLKKILNLEKLRIILKNVVYARFQTKVHHACFLCVNYLGAQYSLHLKKVMYPSFW
jgi:hypothetical protein